MAHLPVAEYLETLPHGTVFAAVHLTDEQDNPLLLRSVYDPEEWQFGGGNLEFADLADGLWSCARRETCEETGLELPERPGPLLVVVYAPPAGAWPFKLGFVFDGGTLTDRRIAGIRLDPGEHSSYAVRPLGEWRRLVAPRRLRLIEAAAQARADGRTVVLHLGAEA
ncbi:NUDIX domain-containing protein [Kitasatospora sp. NBC_00374]|uniref:NUDIX domain-containing protein n=1 Tax=Kitasatospora sp. NBC_00374 TaxID=2975964 RepID=UPI0030E35A96